MELFYIPGLSEGVKQVVIAGAEARHIIRVLRHKVGDEISATDGQGREFRLRLVRISGKEVVAEVIEGKTVLREPRHRVVLAQAVLKGEKLEEVVESVSQLGVEEVIPFVSERVLGRLTERRKQHLENVAISGMKSALRTIRPRIAALTKLEGLAGMVRDFDRTIVFYEEEQTRGLDDVLNKGVKSIMLVVGPEGGFSSKEIELMTQAGAVCCTLGPRRLRAETAAIAGTAFCLGLLGDLG